MGVIIDRASGARFWNREGSTRIGESWKLELRVRTFTGTARDPVLSAFRRDGYLEVGFARYF